jgi:hypothetical protein
MVTRRFFVGYEETGKDMEQPGLKKSVWVAKSRAAPSKRIINCSSGYQKTVMDL